MQWNLIVGNGLKVRGEMQAGRNSSAHLPNWRLDFLSQGPVLIFWKVDIAIKRDRLPTNALFRCVLLYRDVVALDTPLAIEIFPNCLAVTF